MTRVQRLLVPVATVLALAGCGSSGSSVSKVAESPPAASGSFDLPLEPGNLGSVPTESTVGEIPAAPTTAPQPTPTPASPPTTMPTPSASLPSIAPAPCGPQTLTGEGFTPDEYQLPAGVILQLEHLVTVLNASNTRYESFTIVGHTDERPSKIGNEELSMLRADAVAEWLQAAGIPNRLIHTEGHGAREPIDPRSTPAAWESNRRIEVLVSCVESS